ncbi:hypothetical protein CBOM_08134 [Ceraceosorus bombacis]|uniref:Uncharacterized protein n=1 Tax=Ceraceosorus bombacis TaxID=401625 RepID=A0A0P1B917_9BASI|nr:hypothetical protein CBOM_08134 [Ceraceosorus bombacis]
MPFISQQGGERRRCGWNQESRAFKFAIAHAAFTTFFWCRRRCGTKDDGEDDVSDEPPPRLHVLATTSPAALTAKPVIQHAKLLEVPCKPKQGWPYVARQNACYCHAA